MVAAVSVTALLLFQVEVYVNALDTDYVLLAEDDCMIWEHLRGENLEKQLKRALDLLISGQADMVRLRHAWRGCTRYKAAYTYSYFYPVEQLATMWVHAEGLSEAPDWIKSIRRNQVPCWSNKRSIPSYQHSKPGYCAHCASAVYLRWSVRVEWMKFWHLLL